MRSFIKRILPPALRTFLKLLIDLVEWHRRDYAPPSPAMIKRRVLLRNGAPSATWVETGTYLGDTTHFLAKHASKVISLEPESKLYGDAKKRFSGIANIEMINGLSENVFPDLLPRLTGNVNFWLDGHYTFGTTWITYKGPNETPIVAELSYIEKNIKSYKTVSVLIDDVRLFQSAEKDYPRLDYLVEWATRNALNWHIEHDIFVARTF